MEEHQSTIDADITGPLTHNTFGEAYFYNINRVSFTKIDSENIYSQSLPASFLDASTFNIVIGTDSGLLPKYLARKGIPNGSRYIFIEPASVLRQLQKHHLLPEPSYNLIICTPDEWEEHAIDCAIEKYFYINAVTSYNAICVREGNVFEYTELSWLITERLGQLNWEHAMTLSGEAFIEQQLKNLADNVYPASLFRKRFEGQSVIILAGGPSLNDVLEWVKEHQHHIVIFAVSRIARQLQQHHIEPDFIFSVDPTDLSFDISKEIFNFGNKPVFVHSFHCVSTLVSQWHGGKFYIGSRFPWKTDQEVANFYGAGPTVTNTAISAAQEWGFKNIILAGVDLCFTREGVTHAQGSNEDKAGPRFDLTGLQVDTYDGNIAPTTSDLLTGIRALEQQAALGESLGCKMFNTAGKAAKVKRIDQISLSDIPVNATAKNIASLVDETIVGFKHDKKFHHYDSIALELDKAIHAIETIRKDANSALKINQTMYNEDGMIENRSDKRALDKLEKKLQRKYPDFSSLIKRFGIRQFIKITKPLDEELTAEQAKEMGRVYYESYQYGCNTLLKLIKNAKKRLRARMIEQQETPDFELLLSQWQNDSSYRRAQLWRNQHPNAEVPEQFKAAFQTCLDQFNTIFNEQNTLHLKRAQSHSSLYNLFHRARLLRTHQKSEDLLALSSALEKSNHPPETIELYSRLIEAYIHELHDDKQQALESYHTLIESDDQRLIEEALLRIGMLSIDLEEHNNAYLALQCLSQLNPFYLPQYASICRLIGNIDEAMDNYCRYVMEFPDDLVKQLELAQIYVQEKDYEKANILVEHVLAKDPNSQTAWLLKHRIDNEQSPIHRP